MQIRLSIIFFAIVLGLCTPRAWAQDSPLPAKAEVEEQIEPEEPPKWDAFPAIQRYQRVGIKERYDGARYNPMRKCIRGFKSKLKARYYAGMVDITDRKGRKGRKFDDAQPYAAAMFEAWKEPAKLKTDRSIVLVMGLRNRSIGVYPGTKWQKLGLDDQAIKDAIAASEYKNWMKRYDLNEAMCSVATAIDFKLVLLKREMERRIEAAKAEVPKIDAELVKAQSELAAVFKSKSIFGDALKAKMAEVQKAIETAKAELETKPGEAMLVFDNARKTFVSIATQRDRYKAGMVKVDEAEAALATLKARVEGRPDADWKYPQAARKKLEACEKIPSEIRDTFKEDASAVTVCMATAQADIGRADGQYHFKADVIPKWLAVAAIILILAMVLAVFLRRLRILRILDPELREWEVLLGWAATRLGKIQNEYASYLTERELWQGEAADLDRATILKLNQAFLLQATGQEILDRAKKLRSSSFLPVSKLDNAAYALKETAVDFTPDLRDDRCPVMAYGESYSAKSAELKADLAMALADAVGLLAKVDSYMSKIDEDTRIATQAVEAAREAVRARQGLQLPVENLSQELDARLQELAKGRSLVAVDPVQAAIVLEAAAEHLVEFQTRTQVGNEVVREVRQTLIGLGAKLRKAMHKLAGSKSIDEPGFAPKTTLDAGSGRVDEILAQINQGNELVAQSLKDELAADLNTLRHLLAVRAEAPKLIPVMSVALAQQRDALNGHILKIRMAIQKADAEIQKGYTPFLARLTDFQRVLSKVSRTQSRVDAEVADGHYLAAMAMLLDLMGPYQEGVELIAQLVNSTGIQVDEVVGLPEAWKVSVSAQWDGSEFLPKRPTGGSNRW